jgi:gas vesicle protein
MENNMDILYGIGIGVGIMAVAGFFLLKKLGHDLGEMWENLF